MRSSHAVVHVVEHLFDTRPGWPDTRERAGGEAVPVCCTCHEDKPEEAFAFQSLATGERQAQCRACHAVYRRAHYLRTKPAYIENERLRLRGQSRAQPSADHRIPARSSVRRLRRDRSDRPGLRSPRSVHQTTRGRAPRQQEAVAAGTCRDREVRRPLRLVPSPAHRATVRLAPSVPFRSARRAGGADRTSRRIDAITRERDG